MCAARNNPPPWDRGALKDRGGHRLAHGHPGGSFSETRMLAILDVARDAYWEDNHTNAHLMEGSLSFLWCIFGLKTPVGQSTLESRVWGVDREITAGGCQV